MKKHQPAEEKKKMAPLDRLVSFGGDVTLYLRRWNIAVRVFRVVAL